MGVLHKPSQPSPRTDEFTFPAVDVLPVSKIGDLTPYGAIIAGSAIRVGKLLPEVMTFIEKNQPVLGQKAFSVFLVCMTLNEDTPANRATVSAYLEPVRALVKPVSEGLFAGVMNLSKLPVFERLVVQLMKVPQGDFRKWDQITTWAESLATS